MRSEKIIRSTANGLTRMLILSILNDRPRSGYLVMKEVQTITGLSYHTGVIYPMLYSLENEGLIVGKWTIHGCRNIKHYSLTEKGTKILNSLKDFLKPPVKRLLGGVV